MESGLILDLTGILQTCRPLVVDHVPDRFGLEANPRWLELSIHDPHLFLDHGVQVEALFHGRSDDMDVGIDDERLLSPAAFLGNFFWSEGFELGWGRWSAAASESLGKACCCQKG